MSETAAGATAIDGTVPLIRRLIADALALEYKVGDVDALARMKHNADLCPSVRDQVGLLLQRCERERRVIYDIQGPRDSGVDVVVRTEEEGQAGAVSFIGFQIKADDEMTKGVARLLVDQHFDAVNAYRPLDRYYILLCADPVKRRDTIREVTGMFARTEGVVVVTPAQVAAFLALSDANLASLTTQAVRSGDPLFETAADELDNLTPAQCGILLQAIANHLFERQSTVASLTTSSLTAALYENTPDLTGDAFGFFKTPRWAFLDRRYVMSLEEADAPGLGVVELRDDAVDDPYFEQDFLLERNNALDSADDRVARDFDLLNDYLEVEQDQSVTVDLAAAPALLALLASARVRFGYDVEEVVDYMMRLDLTA